MDKLSSPVLWAYSTSKHTSTQATQFFLVYGVEAMVLIKFTVSTAHLALVSKISNPNDLIQI